MMLVSEDVARWLLHKAERNPALVFNEFAPYRCKLCDKPTAPKGEQRAHVKAHRDELVKAAVARNKAALRALKEANRLRREASRV